MNKRKKDYSKLVDKASMDLINKNILKTKATTTGGEGTLTLKNLEKYFNKLKKYSKATTTGGEGDFCEKCHRNIKFLYFFEGVLFYQSCGYHQLREKINDNRIRKAL